MSLVKNLFYNIEGLTLEIPEWQIPDEGISALSGPSGSGKTTIFRILLGLVTCKGLEWHFKDCDLAKLSIQDRRLGVVFQSFELFPHLTARENVWFAAKARKISREAYEENLKLFINDLNMKTFIDRKTEFLSGGEKQRVAIARALMGEPRFLLLDEPFSSLDEELKNEARLLVKKILMKKNIPTLLITHDQRDIDQICDAVFYLRDGKISTR